MDITKPHQSCVRLLEVSNLAKCSSKYWNLKIFQYTKLLYYLLICFCSHFLLFLVRVYGIAFPELFFTLPAAFFTYKIKKMNHQMKLTDERTSGPHINEWWWECLGTRLGVQLRCKLMIWWWKANKKCSTLMISKGCSKYFGSTCSTSMPISVLSECGLASP